MAYIKPLSPLKLGEDHIYPLTTYDQIILPDGSRWNGESVGGSEGEWLDVNLEGAAEGELALTNADLLGGIAADQYALKSEVGTGGNTTVVDAVKVTFSTILAATDWSETAPYSQTITVEGITENDKPYVFVDLSTATEDTVDSIEAEWAKIKYALTSENAVTFYCIKEVPMVDIPIEGEVIRTEVNYTNTVGVEF